MKIRRTFPPRFLPVAALFIALGLSACGVGTPAEDVRSFSDIGVAVDCTECPRLALDFSSDEVVVHDVQEYVFAGDLDSRGPVNGVWRVYNGENNAVGIIDIWNDEFAQVIPLFCGENLLEAYFSSHDGVTVWRQIIVAEDCPGMPDIGCRD